MIRVQREDFDVGAEIARLSAGKTNVGGVCVFVGLVRDMVSEEADPRSAGEADRAAVGTMTLEHYPGMTEKELARIEAEARSRWPLDDALVIHRYGRLEPGDRIVLVAVSSAHREAAFAACHFLIDWLKTRAPFWKQEETAQGGQWVAARDSDDAAAARWKKA